MTDPDQMPGMLWLREDLRQSFLAPQIHLHQALTASSKTASGVAETPEEARARTISETVEIVALESLGPGQLPRRFLPTRDGIAAALTAQDARTRALLEACERRGISDWWLGQGAQAERLAVSWMKRTGLSTWLDAKRYGADLRRVTQLWRVPAPAPVHVVVARSIGSTGQSPMVGYGCALRLEEAAQKALREVLLMEICVMDDYVDRAFGGPVTDNGPRRQMADFAARLPKLLPLLPEVAPQSASPSALFDGDRPVRPIIDWLGGPVTLSALPVGLCGLEVAVCQPLGARPVLMAGPGSPFVVGSSATVGDT